MARGSCLCGKVTYEIEIPVEASGKVQYHLPTITSPDPVNLPSQPCAPHLCHCRMCRKITSAYTSANINIPSADFHLLSGRLKPIRTTHVDDGFEFSILFCPDCGSAIYAEAHIPALEGRVIVQAGTLDEPGEVLLGMPGKELNVKHRLGWMGKVDGAEQREGY